MKLHEKSRNWAIGAVKGIGKATLDAVEQLGAAAGSGTAPGQRPVLAFTRHTCGLDTAVAYPSQRRFAV
jgi:hypothetical protein